MKEVKNFLEANGFKKISTIHKASRKNTYFNDKCTIIPIWIIAKCNTIEDNLG